MNLIDTVRELRDDPYRRTILVPKIETTRRLHVNDESVTVTAAITWLFRTGRFEYNRPFIHRETRRVEAAHEAAMAPIWESAARAKARHPHTHPRKDDV